MNVCIASVSGTCSTAARAEDRRAEDGESQRGLGVCHVEGRGGGRGGGGRSGRRRRGQQHVLSPDRAPEGATAEQHRVPTITGKHWRGCGGGRQDELHLARVRVRDEYEMWPAVSGRPSCTLHPLDLRFV
jgi:hypothetical protein